MSQEADLQNQSSNDALLKVASQLLEQSGINKDDFFSAISSRLLAFSFKSAFNFVFHFEFAVFLNNGSKINLLI